MAFPYDPRNSTRPSDQIHVKAMDKLRGLFSGEGELEPSPLDEGPGIWPMTPKPFRDAAIPTPPPTAPTGDLSSLVPYPSNIQKVQSAYDPSKETVGSMEFGGPKINSLPQSQQLQALSGLKNASAQFGGGFQRPTEELYKQANSDPSTMAPGAGQAAQAELTSRTGAEDFQNLLGRKSQETIQGAESALHPTVQGQAEQVARRAAYPAEAQGRANALSGMLGIQRETARGQAAVEAARTRRDEAVQSMLIRQLGELTTGGYRGESPQEQQDRMAHRDLIIELLQRSRSGEFNLGDFISDEELQQYMTPQEPELDLGQ